VCVNVMVQAACAAPVAVVLLVVPENVPYSVPEAAALPRLVVTLVRSALSAAKMPIVCPEVGADLAVSVVEVCVPAVAKLLTRLAHCVAVTVLAAEGFATAVCPQPLSVAPTPQMSFKLAPAVPPLAVGPTKPL